MPRQQYTPAEDARLKALADGIRTYPEIAAALRRDGFPARSASSIHGRAYRLGAAKPGMSSPRKPHVGWTQEMDEYLREAVTSRTTWRVIAEQMERKGLGRRSDSAVEARAERLRLTRAPAYVEPRVDCRAKDGADPLLRTLLAVHKAPPSNVRPHPFDGQRFDWRALMPVGGCAGSPAAMCAE